MSEDRNHVGAARLGTVTPDLGRSHGVTDRARERGLGQQQHHFLLAWTFCQQGTGVAQCGAHARRKLTGHAGKTAFNCIVIGGIEVLYAVVFDIVAAIGIKAMNGERIAYFIKRFGQQRSSITRQPSVAAA